MKAVEIIPLARRKLERRGISEVWEDRAVKIQYDPTHDLLNIEFLPDVAIEESVEVDGIVLDYAADRRIVAIEILDASKRTSHDPLHLIDVAIIRREQ